MEVERIGDRPRFQHVLDGDRCLEVGQGVARRIGLVLDGDQCELLTGHPELLHVAACPHCVHAGHGGPDGRLRIARIRRQRPFEPGGEVFGADRCDYVVLPRPNGERCLPDGGCSAAAGVLDVGER